ncbi:MAG: malonyl-CoA decarboxylase [Magnetovibrionaceae bacterium]
MSILGDLLSVLFERRDRQSETLTQGVRPVSELVEELVGGRGEISGRAIANQILEAFGAMSDTEKLEFFRFVSSELDLSPTAVREALEAYENKPGKATYRNFMAATEPKRQELIRRLNQVPGATGSLVNMRADLLRLGSKAPEAESIMALDIDFRHLFASWFNRGFLVLRPISWESPANILEKIIAYEAVHAIGSWDDLRSRLEPADRRCYAFFHPAMPDEPLIFVEVALSHGIPNSVQELLADNREPLEPGEADTACFYSISNCQSGLASISFGNSLIKQVVSDLRQDVPNIKTFVTLSPIPALTRWFKGEEGLSEPATAEGVRTLAAHYLLNAKRPDGGPYDPVARFHLGNGARVHAVHAEADTSERGRAQSFGAMVNYLYDLDRINENHERFAIKREIVATDDVLKLSQNVEELSVLRSD